MPLYNTHTCARCRKSFVTDNAWVWCERDPNGGEYARLVVKAYFCSEKCRTEYLVARGWVRDELNRLVPPTTLGEKK